MPAHPIGRPLARRAAGLHAVLLLAAGLVAGACSPVYAADLAAPAPSPIMAAQPDWNGFYFGGHLGVQDANAHYDYSTVFSGALNNHTRIGTIGSAGLGVFGGYNYQIGMLVVGLEGDATFTDGHFRLNGPNFDFLQASNAVYTGSGRVGVLVTPSTLIYGKGGISGIDLSGVDGFGTPFHATTTGVQVGLGVENLIRDDVTFRVEADYTSGLDDLSLNQGFDHYRPSFLWVTAGLAFKFDPLPHHSEEVKLLPSLVTHPPRWTSIYVGGLAGVAAGQVNRFDATFGEMGPYNDLRFTGGAVVGGDVQLGRFVVGAQVDTLFLNATFDDDVGVGLGTVYHRFADISRVSALTGRAGYLITPDTLFYGKAGPAQIRFTPDTTYFAAINPSVVTTSRTMSALQYGLGTESYVADHVAVRVEGLYTRATDSITINGIVPAQTKLQPSALTGTVGLVLKY